MDYPYTLIVPVATTTPIEDLYAAALLIDAEIYNLENAITSQSEILYNIMTCGTDPAYLGVTFFPKTPPNLEMTLFLSAERPWEDLDPDLLAAYPHANTRDEALFAYLSENGNRFNDFGFVVEDILKPTSAHSQIEEASIIGTKPDWV